MSDVEKLVAAILAAAKVSAMGERPAGEYVAEYKSFLQILEKQKLEEIAALADDWPDLNAELNVEFNKKL
jgi:hypothetical protein